MTNTGPGLFLLNMLKTAFEVLSNKENETQWNNVHDIYLISSYWKQMVKLSPIVYKAANNLKDY